MKSGRTVSLWRKISGKGVRMEMPKIEEQVKRIGEDRIELVRGEKKAKALKVFKQFS